MASVLKFPKLGSEKIVPLITEPEKESEETAEDFAGRVENWRRFQGVEITVRLVDKERARGWGYRYDSTMARDKKRVAEAKKRGEVPSDYTQEGIQELIKIQRDILKDSLVQVSGIQYGDTMIENITETTALIDALDGCGLLHEVALAATNAQTPSPRQGEL